MMETVPDVRVKLSTYELPDVLLIRIGEVLPGAYVMVSALEIDVGEPLTVYEVP